MIFAPIKPWNSDPQAVEADIAVKATSPRNLPRPYQLWRGLELLCTATTREAVEDLWEEGLTIVVSASTEY